MQKNIVTVKVDPEISANDPMPASFLEPIKALWADPSVQAAVRKGNEFALHDNIN